MEGLNWREMKTEQNKGGGGIGGQGLLGVPGGYRVFDDCLFHQYVYADPSLAGGGMREKGPCAGTHSAEVTCPWPAGGIFPLWHLTWALNRVRAAAPG